VYTVLHLAQLINPVTLTAAGWQVFTVLCDLPLPLTQLAHTQ